MQASTQTACGGHQRVLVRWVHPAYHCIINHSLINPCSPRRALNCTCHPIVLNCHVFCRWEDEQEFDALTEILLPKQVVLATPDAAKQHLPALQSCSRFAAAFTAPSVSAAAGQLWEQLGRAGPPLFLKVRSREALQQCEVGAQSCYA